jgi:hypothetical protein
VVPPFRGQRLTPNTVSKGKGRAPEVRDCCLLKVNVLAGSRVPIKYGFVFALVHSWLLLAQLRVATY